jgi:hypothetical protein
VAMSKADLTEVQESYPALKAAFAKRKIDLHLVSAATGEGLRPLLIELFRLVKGKPKDHEEEEAEQTAPAAKKKSPPAKKRSPPAKKKSPPAKKRSPPAKKKSPPAKKRSPPAKKKSPPAKKKTAPVKNKPPKKKR